MLTKTSSVATKVIEPVLGCCCIHATLLYAPVRNQKRNGAMTTMDTILLAGALWVGGGALLIHGSLTNPDANPSTVASSQKMTDGLLRLQPAALVAALGLIAIWPILFAGLHLGKFSR